VLSDNDGLYFVPYHVERAGMGLGFVGKFEYFCIHGIAASLDFVYNDGRNGARTGVDDRVIRLFPPYGTGVSRVLSGFFLVFLNAFLL